MAEKLLMLALSPTMEEGVIVKWQKNEGDSFKAGDTLCEVETDKAVMEYQSQDDGTLLKIIKPEGDRSKIGDTIAIAGDEGENIDNLIKEVEAEKDKPAAPAESDTSAEDKPAAEEEKSEAPAQSQAAPQDETAIKRGSSPLARKLAEKHNLDLSQIKGTGPHGRIVEKDIQAALASGTAATGSSAARPAAVPSTLTEQKIPVSEKRRVIAKRLSDSKYTAPHYYLKVKAKMDNIMAARQTLNQQIKAKVSVNSFIIKLVAEALRRHPMVNASWNGDTITQHGRIDIALAVAQKDGLITPVIRNCESKGILEIDQNVSELVEKARNNQLQPEDYSNSTFTISNLGMFDIDDFTAIINQPNSAILALGKMAKEAVIADDESMTIETLMTMTLSCDHRVIDGAVGAAFIKELKDSLESPIRALY